MQPHSLDSNISDSENISAEEKDLAEEAILLQKDGYGMLEANKIKADFRPAILISILIWKQMQEEN